MKFVQVFKSSSQNPVEAIEGIAAITCFLFGLYIASPFYVSTTGTAIGSAFADNFGQQFFIGLLFFVVPSIPILLGMFFRKFNTPKWRARGDFGMFLGLTFITFLRLVTIGLTPATWAFSLALGLVCGVCYLYVRVRDA